MVGKRKIRAPQIHYPLVIPNLNRLRLFRNEETNQRQQNSITQLKSHMIPETQGDTHVKVFQVNQKACEKKTTIRHTT